MDNKEKDIKNPAIVIGDWHFNSLGMVRSLGEKDIPVIYINLSDGGYAEDSKYTLKTYHVKARDEVLNCIMSAIKEFGGKPVLFPSCDKAALWIDELYSPLCEKCFCPGFKGEISAFMDKQLMGRIAEESGFIIPKSEVIINDKTAEERIKKLPLPFIVKPRKSVDGSKDDIKICKSETELNEIIKWLKSDECKYSEVLIQEYVDGKNNLMVEYCGCKSIGNEVTLFGQLEKIREYPPMRGSTSFAVIKKEITYLDVDALNKFLETVQFNGLFDLEIKVVDGKPYFLEINFRNGAPSYAFSVAGFNVPFEWYSQVQGCGASRSGIKETTLMSERDDLNNLKDGNINVFTWIKNIRKTDVMMIYNKRDTNPFKKSYNGVINFLFSLLQK